MTPLLTNASNIVKKSFEFIQEYGYILSEFTISGNEEAKIVFSNNETNKEVKFSVCNYNDVDRFFITISIIRKPYSIVHDLISVDVFLDKNNIKRQKPLEGAARNMKNINKYIENYTYLFKTHCIKLITSNNQFPNYFPQWS